MPLMEMNFISQNICKVNCSKIWQNVEGLILMRLILIVDNLIRCFHLMLLSLGSTQHASNSCH